MKFTEGERKKNIVFSQGLKNFVISGKISQMLLVNRRLDPPYIRLLLSTYEKLILL